MMLINKFKVELMNCNLKSHMIVEKIENKSIFFKITIFNFNSLYKKNKLNFIFRTEIYYKYNYYFIFFCFIIIA